MNELISVIVPVYKVELYLEKCVESILSQTYTNLEIILVDDGSPDCCGEMCDRFAQKDNRIKVIHKENGGLSDARNTGLDIARGEYIGFVDSDDWIELDMYQRMLDAIKKYKANLAICCIDKHWLLAGTVTRQDIGNDLIYSNQKLLYELIRDKEVSNYAWNKLYHRSLFNEVRYPKGRLFEDILTTYKVVDKVTRAIHLNCPLYHYLRRDDSIVGSYPASVYVEECCARQELYENVSKQHPELIPALSKRYISSIRDLKSKFMSADEKEARLCSQRIKKEISPFFVQHRDYLKAAEPMGMLKYLSMRFYLISPCIYRKIYPILKRLRK